MSLHPHWGGQDFVHAQSLQEEWQYGFVSQHRHCGGIERVHAHWSQHASLLIMPSPPAIQGRIEKKRKNQITCWMWKTKPPNFTRKSESEFPVRTERTERNLEVERLLRGGPPFVILLWFLLRSCLFARILDEIFLLLGMFVMWVFRTAVLLISFFSLKNSLNSKY